MLLRKDVSFIKLTSRKLARSMAQSSKASTSRILSCDSDSITFDGDTPKFADAATAQNIHKAAQALRASSLVAFPTETVYGLGGSALAGSSAVGKIYKTKGRPSDNPLIVHVSSKRQLEGLVDPRYKQSLPRCYSALMQRFWPGPLTLLVPTLPGELVSEQVTVGLRTVGVRMPAHTVARALIAVADLPIAAPSANSSGRPSPTTAQHVAHDLRDQAEPAYILDGGDCEVGLESTVVSALSQDGATQSDIEALRILRLGGVSPEDLQACLDGSGLSDSVVLDLSAVATVCSASSSTPNGGDANGRDNSFVPSTPGMKYKHYSPDAQVILLRQSSSVLAVSLEEVLSKYKASSMALLGLDDAPLSSALQRNIPADLQYSLGAPDDHATQARRLFGGLRLLDSKGVKVIVVECVSEQGLGRTVMERLRRSAGNREILDVRL